MVKAIFKKNLQWSILCFLCGLVLIGIFVFAYCKDNEASVWGLLLGVFFGIIISLVSALNLFYHFKAYLYIEDGHIKGKYHYFGKIDCSISDVVFALGQNGVLTIQLKSGEIHNIMGIENASDICSLIRQGMSFCTTEQPEKLIDDLNEIKSKKKKGFKYICLGLAIMFINIFVTVFLTDGRELYEFSETDWKIMAVMGAVEFVMVILMFWFAQKVGKYNVPIQKLDYDIKRTIVETKPLLPGNVIKACADSDYASRLTVYGFPNSETVYYSVEKIDNNYNLKKIYTSDIYEDVEDMSYEIEWLIDITEKVLH